MNVLHELDLRLAQWRPEVARRVEQAIADIIALADTEQAVGAQGRAQEAGWPGGFFERTAGALADTPLLREQPAAYETRGQMP